MQINTSESQKDSKERMPKLEYKDSLEDSNGNKSQSTHVFRNTQQSNSTLNLNDIVSGDPKIYKYEYEIRQKLNEQMMQQGQTPQDMYIKQMQYQQRQQDIQQLFNKQLYGEQQSEQFQQYNQNDTRRRLFQQYNQQENQEKNIDQQNYEVEDRKQGQEGDIQFNQQQLDYQQNKENDENQYYDQDNYQNEQDEQNFIKQQQQYYQNYKNDEESDLEGTNINNGNNVLLQYLQKFQEKGQIIQAQEQDQGQEQDDEEVQGQIFEDSIQQQDGVEHLITELFEGENKFTQSPHQQVNGNMKAQTIQNEQNSLSYTQNQQAQNIQREQGNHRQKYDSKQNQVKYSGNEYPLPVQINPHLQTSNSHQTRLSNQAVQQQYESKNLQIRDSNISNRSNASSNNQNQSSQIYSIQQSNKVHEDNNKNNFYREIDNNQNKKNNQQIIYNKQQVIQQNNLHQLDKSNEFNKELEYLTNSQKQNVSIQNTSSNLSSLQQSGYLQQPLIVNEIREQSKNKVKQQNQQQFQQNQIVQQNSFGLQQDQSISQQIIPHPVQSKKDSLIQNEVYTESFQNKNDRNFKNLEQDSNKTNLKINNDDNNQLKKQFSNRGSFSNQQQNNIQDLKLEDSLQDQQNTISKQYSSLQSQFTPDKQMQFLSITGNNTKELFEYSKSSSKNMANTQYDSQPRDIIYESTVKNRLKVDLFKKLTDPQLIEKKNNIFQNNSNHQDLKKRDYQKDNYNSQNDNKQQSIESEICFYSEISPIDKGSRYNRENIYQNALIDEQMKRQSNTYLYNPNSNQITFQNNYQFQSNSNFRESLDDELSHNTPKNQPKKQQYYEKSNENKSQNEEQQNNPDQIRESKNIDTNEDIQYLIQKEPKQQSDESQNLNLNQQIPKSDLKDDQLEQEIRRLSRLEEQQSQKQKQDKEQNQKSLQNPNHNEQSQISTQQQNENNMARHIFERYIKKKRQNKDCSYDEQLIGIGDQINNIDQVQQEYDRQIQQYKQIDEMNYNEYNAAKLQRTIAKYQPDFVQKLHEQQQMSEKKKKEHDELEQMESQMYESYYQSRSPPQKQPKENSFASSFLLMKGINLIKVNQSIKNQIKSNMNSYKKGHNKSVSQNNSSMRYVSNNNIQMVKDYSQLSPEEICVNNNSLRNDQKIRNEVIINNFNNSPSREVNNLNSSLNKKSYLFQNNNIYKDRINMTQQLNNNLQIENIRAIDKQRSQINENQYNSCSRCLNCKQQLPPKIDQTDNTLQNQQIKSNSLINYNTINSQLLHNKNNLENQSNKNLNLQMSEVTSPMSQMKSNYKSPIKLDQLNNSTTKLQSNLNSPFYLSQKKLQKNKNIDFVNKKFNNNNRDYGNIPKKQQIINISHTSNLNMTAINDIQLFNLEDIEKQCDQFISTQEYEQAHQLLTKIESFIFLNFEKNHLQRIYVYYLNARIQQGIGQSVSAIQYCERGLNEIKKEDLFIDKYLFKYAFTLRQIAYSECKKIQQFQQQLNYLNQMEEQLKYCEKNLSKLDIEIVHIYNDYNSKFNLQIQRELANANQILRDNQTTSKNIRIVQQI